MRSSALCLICLGLAWVPATAALEPTATRVFSGTPTAPLLPVVLETREEAVLVATQDRYVRAWLWDGEMAWERNVRISVATLSVAPDGTFVCIGSNGGIVRLSPEGEIASVNRWTAQSGVGGPGVDSRGNIWFVDSQSVHAISPFGTPVWSATFPGDIADYSSNRRETFFLTQNGEVFVVTSGALGKRIPIDTAGSCLSAAPDGKVVVGDETGTLRCVDQSGGQLWSLSTGSAVKSLTSASWGVVALLSSGEVHNVGWDGRVISRAIAPHEAPLYIAATEPAGALLSGPRGGVLRLKGERSVRSTLRLPNNGEAVSWIAASSGGCQIVLVSLDWRADFFQIEPPERPAASMLAPADGSSVPPMETVQRSPFWHIASSVLEQSGAPERVQLLGQIENRIEEANLYGVLDDVTDTLARIAQEPYRFPRVISGAVVNDFPAARQRAVRALSRILDEPSRKSLMDVARRDPDPFVAAAALRGLSLYGYDRGGRIARIAAERFREGAREERGAIAESAVSVAAMTGGGEDAQLLLQAVVESNVSRAIRTRAIELVRPTTR